jgi:hypothetical protein
MSNQDKSSLIGSAVTTYQAAKMALACVEEKIKQVQNAYKQGAESGRGPYPALRVVDGRLAGYSGPESWMTHLMNESEFAVLLAKRASCEADFKRTKAVVDSLGLGDTVR